MMVRLSEKRFMCYMVDENMEKSDVKNLIFKSWDELMKYWAKLEKKKRS